MAARPPLKRTLLAVLRERPGLGRYELRDAARRRLADHGFFHIMEKLKATLSRCIGERDILELWSGMSAGLPEGWHLYTNDDVGLFAAIEHGVPGESQLGKFRVYRALAWAPEG